MDIAIVGAGPAGTRGVRARDTRRTRHDLRRLASAREACGGGITGARLLVADAIDPAAFPQTIVRLVRSRRSASAGQARLRAPRFGGRAHGSGAVADGDAIVPLGRDALVVSSRAAFDAAMLAAAQRAGAVLDRSRVTDVSIDRGGVSVATTRGRHRAAFLVGADGANSLVRRRVATAFRRDQLSIATGFFAHGVTSDEIVLGLTANPPGYIWSFRVRRTWRSDLRAGGHATSLPRRCARRPRHGSRAALRRALASRRTSWPIPSLSAADLDALVPAGPRWALVGDAAGLVDPITREGIFFALASGEWIADALAADAAALDYATRVHDEAVSELARAARFKAGFFRPSFIGLMVRALQQSSSIRAVMADLVAGRQSYRTLKRRLLGTFEWGVAMRLLVASRESLVRSR